jgi:vancomycin resistance protein YoaR
MTTMAYRRRRKETSVFEQAVVALFLGAALFAVAFILAFLAFQGLYLGRIYPGVSIAGVDVSGLSLAAAAERALQQNTFPEQGRILIYDADQGQSWTISPAQLGLSFDPQATAAGAFQLGRRGDLFQRFADQVGSFSALRDISPVLIFDQSQAYNVISRLAESINQPVVNAAVILNGTEVSARPGQVGRQVDIPATLALLSNQMKNLSDSAVPLVIRQQSPLVLDASAQAETTRRILSQPLTLVLPDGQDGKDKLGPWTLEPASLAAMLDFSYFEKDGATEYRVGLKKDALYNYLAGLASPVAMAPENTRFTFNDDTRLLEVIQPAVTGRDLNLEATTTAIEQKLLQGEHTISLEFVFTPPAVTDQMTGEQLGIRELIHTETSYFYGSSETRIQNIVTAAKRFHGLLVAPGETFSMAQAMGEVSLDNGYAEALIIYGGQTVKGVGGGVCQVSTTLFRAAFFSGFPVVERHPHAYRVSYYEKISGNRINPDLAGLDATVFVPVVDFKFTNNTPNWLLMETYVSPTYSTITWKFYSTSEGRTVEWNTTGPANPVPAPKPLYRENPDLSKGEVKQVDWEAEGAEITVHRTVRRNGEVLFQDTFYTKYEPWQAIYEYGPGTEGMPPQENEEPPAPG